MIFLACTKKCSLTVRSHKMCCFPFCIEVIRIPDGISLTMKLFAAFPEEFIRLEQQYSCNMESTDKVFRDFAFGLESPLNQSDSLNKCENYCSIEKKCQLCAMKCSDSCYWSAIPVCLSLKSRLGLEHVQISMKPGK